MRAPGSSPLPAPMRRLGTGDGQQRFCHTGAHAHSAHCRSRRLGAGGGRRLL
ncbi:hypothetical protein ACFFX0_14945 [Citricoccus parietis]|uniref:Uncharacterized protein n=1 Tax=Citricoccus parietis TaxID=592307 RepID=A0ABV5G0G4_9MICC